MFGRKNKTVLRKHVEEKVEESYVIPQIADSTTGLRIARPQFTKTEALSPMEGPYTKDVLIVPDHVNHTDIDVAYDAFRVEKRLTEEDEIKRYGMTHHEFQSVDSKLNSTNYVRKETTNKSKAETVGINFGVVSDESSHQSFHQSTIDEDKGSQAARNVPIINFGENTYSANEKKVEFNEVDLSNESLEEDNYIARPNGKVPDFINYKSSAFSSEEINNDIPKTIVSHSNRHTDEKVSMPSFVANNNVRPSEPRVFDAPEVDTGFEQSPYETIKNASFENKTIYQDKYANYEYPPLSLLNPAPIASTEMPDWLEEKREVIDNTLADFGIEGKVVHYTYGPAVTRYEVKLSNGVNVKRISQIEDNIKMNLSARTIRIEAPIPGKSNVGIEVPNNKIRIVSFSEIVDRDEFKESQKPLLVALGLDIDGKPVYTDIAKMPHGLVGGGTGSGKSVCINGLLVSLILRNRPDEVKLILVDPKQVELANYSDLPHLVTPVINDPKMASEALKWACEEMDRRYRAFSSVRAKDLVSYNEKIKNDKSIKKLEFIVIVIDELADLMMTCGNDVEDSIQRITQMGRAAGIHLIVATQRPTTDVVKGTIKANIPTRIAFRVSQFVDSNTILDGGGAENLLGRGDMLLKELDLPVRVQGAYISDEEISRVCDFIRDHYPADYVFTHEQLQNNIKNAYGAGGANSEDSELLYEIASNVIERGTCSINNIQTTFSLGFNRAQKIVDILEEMGIVSAKKGTTGREILMTQQDIDQMFRKGN